MNTEHRSPAIRIAGIALAFAPLAGVTVLATPGPAAAQAVAVGGTANVSTVDHTAAARANRVPLAVRIRKANRALVTAMRAIYAGHPQRAGRPLTIVLRQQRAASVTAISLIGKPPTDPESDDVPGPPAVTSVLQLQHRIGTTLVPALPRLTGPRVIASVDATLRSTYYRRNVIVARVTALPAEGALDDYADGLADSLPQYDQEVSQIQAARAEARNAAGAAALTRALSAVQVTRTRMNAAFGGGE